MANDSPLARARDVIETYSGVIRMYERDTPGVRETAIRMSTPGYDGRGDPAIAAKYPWFRAGHPEWPEVLSQCQDAAVYRLWARTRTVYAPDEQFLAHMREDYTDDAVPLSLLRQVPHPDPFILFPAPGTDDLADPVGACWGAFAYGRRDARRDGDVPCSTAADDISSVGLMFTLLMETPEQGPMISVLRANLPLSDTPLTVAEIAGQAVERFRYNRNLPQERRDDLVAFLTRQIPRVLDVLLYVVADDTDVETQDLTRNKKKSTRTRPSDIDRFVKVGWVLGPALTRERERAERTAREQSAETGRTVKPHRRRGHKHLYWTGKGRTVPKIKTVKPTWVHKDLLTKGDAPEPEVTTVRPVRRKA